MKKKYLIISLLGATAVTSLVGGIALSNLNNNSIEEKVADDLFIESTDACDDVFGNGISSFAGGKVSYNKISETDEENALYSPKLGVQMSAVNDDGKISIRYTAAISSLNVDAVWTRTVYDQSGNVVRGTKNIAVTTAYRALSTTSGLEQATDIAVGDEHPYNYYVIYTLTNIPVDSNKQALYKVDCNLTLSQGNEKVATPTGSVDAQVGGEISTYEATVEIGTNYTYHGSNSSAGNGQYINGKLKTIYSQSDTTLNTNYMSLNITKTYSDKTEKSTLYYNSFNTAGVTTSGFSAGEVGKQTISVNNGAATYDIYVLANNIAYKDSNGNYVVTVDKNYDGAIGAVSGTNGNMFTTIGQALEFLQNSTFVTQSDSKILNISAGYYYEKLEITTPNLTINGAGYTRATYTSDVNYNAQSYAAATIIEYDSLVGNAAGEITHITDSTQTVAVRDTATNCKINGVTISNYYNNIARYANTSYAGNGERGLALLCQADQFQMDECSLLGWQDTVEFFTGRQYIKDSYVCGAVDFIFGTNSTTYFDGCTIESIKSKTSSQEGVTAYVTAFKGSNKNDVNDTPTYGAIFNDCTFTSSSDFVGEYAIARPWTVNSRVAVLNSKFTGNTATKESTTISTGLINDVNVSTLGMKFYNNKDSNNESFTFTDDLTNVDTTLTPAAAANYTDFSVVFGKTNGDLSYALAWDPVNGVEQDNNTYYYFNGSSSDTGTSYTYSGTIQKTSGTFGGLSIDATSGKLYGRENDTQITVGTIITFNVLAGSTVTVNSYYSGRITLNGYASTSDTLVQYYATATTVTLEVQGGEDYLHYIIISPNGTPTSATLTGITVENAPTNEYTVGDDYDISGIKVKASYSDNTFNYVTNYTTDAFTVVNKNTAGTYTVTVSYGGFEDTFNVKYVSTVSDTFEENAVIDFSSSSALAQSLANNKITYATGFTYNDHKDSIQLQSATAYFSFKVKAGATITVTSFGGGYGYLLINGVSNNNATTYELTVTTDSTITIAAENSTATGNTWDRSYLKKIEITYPAQSSAIDTDTTVTFGSNGNYKSSVIDFSHITVGDNGGNNSQVKEGYISFDVLAGAVVTISSYDNHTNYSFSNGSTSSTQTGTSYEYTATSDCTITITPTSSDNYFYSISITYPVQSNVITEATNLMFGEDYGNYSSNSKFTITATINDTDRNNNAMVYGGNIEFTVAAGAQVELYVNYSADYDINGTKVSGLVGSEGHKVYTFDTQTDVVIKCDLDENGDNYFYWIKVTFPNS